MCLCVYIICMRLCIQTDTVKFVVGMFGRKMFQTRFYRQTISKIVYSLSTTIAMFTTPSLHISCAFLCDNVGRAETEKINTLDFGHDGFIVGPPDSRRRRSFFFVPFLNFAPRTPVIRWQQQTLRFRRHRCRQSRIPFAAIYRPSAPITDRGI